MPDFIMTLDNSVADFMINIQNSFLTVFFAIPTYLSEKGLIWIALGLVLLARKKTRKLGAVYAITLLCAFVSSECVLKYIICRTRPFIARPDISLLISAPSGYSFPSSHSCSSFSCAACLSLNRKKYAPYALAFAFWVAVSRLYFTVHYFTDVLAGTLLGVLCAIIVFAVFKKAENRKISD